MKKYEVPYYMIGSVLGDEELKAVADTFRHNSTLSCGPQRDLFEAEFAKFVGARYSLTATSCTVALQFATYLLGLKPGDEVIATPHTYQATIQSLLTQKVQVRFCDIDSNTLCLDPVYLDKLITPRTRAIYLTHYGGLMADMDAVMEIARHHDIVVIEDCAHAHGSEYKGRRAGSTGHIGCFSFSSSKNMTTLGEGGMITLNDERWAEVIKTIRSIEPDARFVPRHKTTIGPYAKPEDQVYRHEKNAYTHDCAVVFHPGTNGSLSEPAAAVGRVQLRKLQQVNERRRQVARMLDSGLWNIPGIRVQIEPPSYKHVYHLYSFFVRPGTGLRHDELAAAIEDEGVQVVLRYFPLHLLPEWRFRGHDYGECPVAERVWFEELINLPCYPTLTDEQVEYMIDAVARAAKRVRH